MKFLILTIGRTGHNAIIKWLVGQLEGGTTHNMDCINTGGELKPKRVDGNGVNSIHVIERFSVVDFNNIVETMEFDHKILIVRDSYNMIASMYKHILDSKIPLGETNIYQPYTHNYLNKSSVIDMWKNHIKECLGETDNMSDFTIINYNYCWSASCTNREILKWLN